MMPAEGGIADTSSLHAARADSLGVSVSGSSDRMGIATLFAARSEVDVRRTPGVTILRRASCGFCRAEASICREGPPAPFFTHTRGMDVQAASKVGREGHSQVL